MVNENRNRTVVSACHDEDFDAISIARSTIFVILVIWNTTTNAHVEVQNSSTTTDVSSDWNKS